jgi:HNH endonuclease
MSTSSSFPPSPQEKNVRNCQSSVEKVPPTTDRTVALSLGDWMATTCGMTCEQEGAFISFVTCLNANGARLPDDDRQMTARIGMSLRVWRRLRSDLLSRGAIVHIDGFLTAAQFERDLAARRGKVSASEFYPREAIPMATRRAVYERDGYRCRKCGSDRRLSLDHIIAVTSGGDNSEENLRTLCLPCNLKKGSRNGECAI